MLQVYSDEDLLAQIRAIYNVIGVPLTTKLLVENGFPKNAVGRRLGGIRKICETLEVPCGEVRSTIAGRSLEDASPEIIYERLASSGKTSFSTKEVELFTGFPCGSLTRSYGDIRSLVESLGFKFIPEVDKRVPYLENALGYEYHFPIEDKTKLACLYSIRICAKENNYICPSKRLYEAFYKNSLIQEYLVHVRRIVRSYENSGGWLQACRDAGLESKSDISVQTRWLNYFETTTGILLEREKSFDNCLNPKTGRKLYWDGFNEEKNLLVEYQDPSHFMEISYYSGDSGLEERKEKDKFKVEWAKDHNFRLLVWDFNSDLLNQRLAELFKYCK